MRIRGPGELMGTKQAGSLDLRIGDLIQDSKMLEVARQAALELVESNPSLAGPEYRLLVEKARGKWSTDAAVVVS